MTVWVQSDEGKAEDGFMQWLLYFDRHGGPSRVQASDLLLVRDHERNLTPVPGTARDEVLRRDGPQSDVETIL